MKLRDFLNAICEDGEPLRTLAGDVIERMSKRDFEELYLDARWHAADMWEEKAAMEKAMFRMNCPPLKMRRADLKDRHPVTLEALDGE